MRVKKLYDKTYEIKEWGPFSTVKMYLLCGDSLALLIDSGYGTIDLKKTVSKITDKPVILYNTHGHLDHANGSFAFDAHLHPADSDIYDNHSSPEFLGAYFRNRSFERAEMKPLPIGSLELGGREVEVIHTPGHTQGSVSILDSYSKIAFCGDTVNPFDVWLGLDESSSVAEYRKSLTYLLAKMRERDIDRLCSGHSAMPMPAGRLENYIALCGKILSGEKTGRAVNKGICRGNKARYKNAAIIYKRIK